jgi:hypothetical protein
MLGGASEDSPLSAAAEAGLTELTEALNDMIDSGDSSEGRISKEQAAELVAEAIARMLGGASEDSPLSAAAEAGLTELTEALNDMIDSGDSSEGRISDEQAAELVAEAIAQMVGGASEDSSVAASGGVAALPDNAESRSVLATAAAMNWTLEVGGQTIDAQATLLGE